MGGIADNLNIYGACITFPVIRNGCEEQSGIGDVKKEIENPTSN